MHAIRRLCAAPLILVAAAAIAAGPAHLTGSSSSHPRPLADCPLGSSWDNILQRCV